MSVKVINSVVTVDYRESSNNDDKV